LNLERMNENSSSIRVPIVHRAAALPANQYPGTCDYLGGRFETSDTNIIDAVAREVHEETDLYISSFNSYAELITWVERPEYRSRKRGSFVSLSRLRS
jgi:8-oxo-dGTP pyrophosphatase MutT (NUDIX family)